jgi:hypothetical protein
VGEADGELSSALGSRQVELQHDRRGLAIGRREARMEEMVIDVVDAGPAADWRELR